MSTGETVLIVIALVLIILVTGNIVFSKLAERRNPPVGMFIQCDGVRLHYIERGYSAAPCVVLFHGNGPGNRAQTGPKSTPGAASLRPAHASKRRAYDQLC